MKQIFFSVILLGLLSGCTSRTIQRQFTTPTVMESSQGIAEPNKIIQITNTNVIHEQTSTPAPETITSLHVNENGLVIGENTCIDAEVYESLREQFLQLNGFQAIEDYLSQARESLSLDYKIDTYITPGWVEEGSAESLVTVASNFGLVSVGLDGRVFDDGSNKFQGRASDYAICLIVQDLFRAEEMYPLVIAAQVGDRWTMTLNQVTVIDDLDSPPIPFSPLEITSLIQELNNRLGYFGKVEVELQYPRTTGEYGQLWRQNALHSRVRNYDLAMAIIGDKSGYLAVRSEDPVSFQVWDPIGSILPQGSPREKGTIGFIPGKITLAK